MKNKKHYVYVSMAIAIVLSMVLIETKANALVLPNVGLEKVGIDPDDKRADFEAAATHPDADRSFTSIKIEQPDEITNDAAYKATAIANNTYRLVSSLSDFISAWRDADITYIEVEKDLPNTTFTNGERPNGASVIVQGNGHTVDLGNNTLKLGQIKSETTTTFNNIELKEDLTVGTIQTVSTSLLNANNGIGTKLTVNLHDFNVSQSTVASKTKGPINVIYGIGARVVLSGENTFKIAGSITHKAGSVEVANNAVVKLERNPSDLFIAEFNFDKLPSGSVSKFSGLKMGDGSTNDASQYASTGNAPNAQPVSGNAEMVKTGDYVTWKLLNFGYFTRIGGYDSPAFTFGQSNTIDIPKTINGNMMTAGYGKDVVFNAGTTLDITQKLSSDYSPIQNSGGAIRFISPKTLHFAIETPGSLVKAGKIYYATSGSAMYITNSVIEGWTGTNARPNSPNFSSTFRELKVLDNGARVDGSNRTDTNLFGATTREFQTVATGVGEIKINYIDQNGNKVGDANYPLIDNVNFVGQSFNLATKEFAIDNMPTGYKWAIDEQVYEKAGRGDQGQPGGDNTDADDNGDGFGQANFAIVPMQGETYTYNIYVYSESNPNTTYTYVDPWTGLSFKSDKVTVGSEKVGNYVPAHVGNTIDWTNKLYTETNVPTGYVYVPSRLLPPTMSQPTTTEVKDAVTPSNTIIYVYNPSYKGSLTLSAVPNLDFGDQLISPENRGKLYPATFSDDLTVTDDRRNVKDGWHLSVQQAAPLTSTDGKTVLRNAIFFREVDGGTLKPLEGGSDLAVYNDVSQAALGFQEIVKPTSSWNKKADGAGFYLKDNGKLQAGDYSTVLTWTLGAGPSQ
ncbi:pectate lyase-like adhesive domain-containing protein [Pseudolactococcus reticulitermitis]|uniref:pectate lyase-like adhesive domain-containing protein n=1 Tax=Pseudolactococcus reticulitermitis TaxID=2025039 RepID=UPI0012FFB290|nr:pectate lyase-like adhesive domain-containing protein [Lactococcus reticulitermitis]